MRVGRASLAGLVASAQLVAGACLAEAQTRPAPPAIAGSVLHGEGVDAFRHSVQMCWNIGALSAEAMEARVELHVDFDAQGHPLTETIRLVSAEGGDKAATELFESARRALVRCGKNGLPLPPALRAAGLSARLNFDPTGMRQE